MPRISELPAATPLAGSELVPIVQAGEARHAPASAFMTNGSQIVADAQAQRVLAQEARAAAQALVDTPEDVPINGVEGQYSARHYAAKAQTGASQAGESAAQAHQDRLWIEMNGTVIAFGTGAPASDMGVNGGFYIDTDTYDFYGPKRDGSWGIGVSLIGPPGAPGDGTGDVVGPPGAIDGHVAVFDGPTGKILRSGGSASRIGVVEMFAGIDLPDGYLWCDGAEYDRTEEAALFAVIGTRYGAGNGTTTFNVPNAGGRVPVGAGTGIGSPAYATGVAAVTRDVGDAGGMEPATESPEGTTVPPEDLTVIDTRMPPTLAFNFMIRAR
jgi:hypothetical protein